MCYTKSKYALAVWLFSSLPLYSSNSIDLSTCSRSEKHNANSCTNVGNKIYYNSTYAFCYQWGVTFHFNPNLVMFYKKVLLSLDQGCADNVHNLYMDVL